MQTKIQAEAAARHAQWASIARNECTLTTVQLKHTFPVLFTEAIDARGCPKLLHSVSQAPLAPHRSQKALSMCIFTAQLLISCVTLRSHNYQAFRFEDSHIPGAVPVCCSACQTMCSEINMHNSRTRMNASCSLLSPH